MNPRPDALDHFLRALAAAGVPVGPTEVERIALVVRAAPASDPERFAALLRRVLVRTDADAAAFDRLVDDWLKQPLARDTAHPESPPPPSPVLEPLPPTVVPPRAFSRRTLIAVATAVLLGFVGLRSCLTEKPSEVKPPDKGSVPPAEPRPESRAASRSASRPESLPASWPEAWASWPDEYPLASRGPTPLLEEQPLGWPVQAVGALLVLGGVLLFAFYRGRDLTPRIGPAGPGPVSVPVTGGVRPKFELLASEDVRTLAWGVDKYVSEDLTGRLDLPRTVHATARAAGVFTPVSERSVYQREVWIWRDAASDASRLADDWCTELRAALAGSGLSVRTATFLYVPDELTWESSFEAFAPDAVDGAAQQAVVLVVTDGAGLRSALRRGDGRYAAESALRVLSRWPRLRIVDVGRPEDALADALAPYSVTTIAPNDVPRFLGGAPATGVFRPRDLPALRMWAAAASLPETGGDVVAAMALRRRLGLPLAAGAWPFVAAEADLGRRGDRGLPPSEVRRLRLQWLADSVDGDVAAPDADEANGKEGGWFGRALKFWRERIEAVRNEAVESAAAATPFEDTPADRRLTLAAALIDLWDEPERAAERLNALHADPELRDVVRSRVRGYSARRADEASPSRRTIRLPWLWESLSTEAQARFAAMDFGGADWSFAAGALRRPGLLIAAVAAAAVAGALALAIPTDAALPQTPPPATAESQPAREVARIRMVRVPGGRFRMGSPDEAKSFTGNRQPFADEFPQHDVEVGAFQMSETPITRAQWIAVASGSPDADGAALPVPEEWASDVQREDRDRLPANYVSWNDAVVYCNRLSRKAGLRERYVQEGGTYAWREGADGFRLPTEAEFEYACRAGTTTSWFCGEDEKELQRFAWFDANAKRVEVVGTREPNPWGLFDMAGNVWQWCFDGLRTYDDEPQVGPKADPLGPLRAGSGRAARGGSVWVGARSLRSALRVGLSPELRDGDLGFRVVRGARRQHG